MDEGVIRSSQTGACITFSARSESYFDVRFSSPEVSFGKTIYDHTSCLALIELFEHMTISWQGWQGSMEWASVESDIRLGCTHDGLGHIDLELSLIDRSGHAEWWQTTVHLMVDAGQLDRIAFELRRFFMGQCPLASGQKPPSPISSTHP